MEQQQLLDLVRQGGVVGEGGAGFPAHVKYDAQVDTVIANGCECEPLLYSDQHIMANHAAEIVSAMKAIIKATGASRGAIGIKAKYSQIGQLFEAATQDSNIDVFRMDNFYPAGDEQILVHEVTGQSIPPLGLPKDVGAVVANVATLLAVNNAINGQPVTHKIVTVTGSVAKPSVIRVPIGTSVRACVAACGNETVDDPVYVMGGPMMGKVIDDQQVFDETVISKTSGAIIVLPRGHVIHQAATLPEAIIQKRAATSCIQCRACTELCPRYLIGQEFKPHEVMRALGAGGSKPESIKQAQLCSECGACEAFSCPMGLSPRRINGLLKQKFREHRIQYDGSREIVAEQSQFRDFRKIPTSRLAMKLGIHHYMALHPEFVGDISPATVSIPLQQHIGAPSIATVQVGDEVNEGDCIGVTPEGALGAMIHASMSGKITAVGTSITIQGARREH
ncbi:SLBB domain-containing protein [Neiella sp. HB171785]|uniref:SLBB domain-containing protein n=1 Tax=Neiella litorisoli TaxID=2771431 RepID=A0A8J6QHL4_9GAMM|nr:4Fe-4S dicluster domain-containing protein [Neiella litorisoli]MBD1388658.1 SLBB domain-containing protein [Neiella litorisoli]